MFFSPTKISLLSIVDQFQLSGVLLQQEYVPEEPTPNTNTSPLYFYSIHQIDGVLPTCSPNKSPEKNPEQ